MAHAAGTAVDILRGVRNAGHAAWPRFLSARDPWPGCGMLFALWRCQDDGRANLWNAAAVENGRLRFVRPSGDAYLAFRGVVQVGIPPGTPMRLRRAAVLSGVAALRSGDALSLSSRDAGGIVGRDGFKFGPRMNMGRPGGGVPGHDCFHGEATEMFRRALDAWCRAVAPFCDLEAAAAAWNLSPLFMEDLDPGEAPRPRAHAVLRDPRLLRAAAATRILLDGGVPAARAADDLRMSRPWLARQALTDLPLMRAVASGARVGSFVGRRFGLSPRRRRAFEDWLSAARGAGVRAVAGGGHPVLGDGLLHLARGEDAPFMARAAGWVPDALLPRPGRDAELFPVRAQLLGNLFDRIWEVPCWAIHHPKTPLFPGGMSRYHASDWRIRPHGYAVRNMADMLAGGGVRLADIPDDADHADRLLGLASDVLDARTWAASQSVAPALARAARAAWQADPDFPGGGAAVERMGAAGSHRLHGIRDPAEWFSVAAAALCHDERHLLLPALSDAMLPRSVKRLARAADAHHRLLAARGITLPEGFEDGWPPLFAGGRLELPEAPGVSAECLVSAAALAGEGEVMRHCVGGYAARCKGGTQHILALRDASGTGLSTARLTAAWRRDGDGRRAGFKVAEHRGPGNGPPPPEAAAFLSALAARLEMPDRGGVALHPEVLLRRPPEDGIHYIEHDPWGSGAAETEAEAFAVFGESSRLAVAAEALAAAMLRGPLPWMRVAPPRA